MYARNTRVTVPVSWIHAFCSKIITEERNTRRGLSDPLITAVWPTAYTEVVYLVSFSRCVVLHPQTRGSLGGSCRAEPPPWASSGSSIWARRWPHPRLVSQRGLTLLLLFDLYTLLSLHIVSPASLLGFFTWKRMTARNKFKTSRFKASPWGSPESGQGTSDSWSEESQSPIEKGQEGWEWRWQPYLVKSTAIHPLELEAHGKQVRQEARRESWVSVAGVCVGEAALRGCSCFW